MKILVKFLHTADWQIGKPFKNVVDQQKRFRIQQERLNSVRRISDIILGEDIEFVLIAGDLFDSNTVKQSIILETLEIIRSFNCNVFIIPGNHDHGGCGGLWRKKEVITNIQKRSPNIAVLNEEKIMEIDNAILIPCPLTRQRDCKSPTSWIKNIEWNNYTNEKPRIVIAHGSVVGFASKDYDNSGRENNHNQNNKIDFDEINCNHIDYFALGDWHSMKRINNKSWYSGTPEPDRFSRNDNEKRGQVLIVDCNRNQVPKVKHIKTSQLYWHNIKINLNSNNDLDKLKQNIETITKSRINRDLLRLEVNGQLNLSQFNYYDLMIKELTQNLLHLRVKGKCLCKPNEEEIEGLIDRPNDPLISIIAESLFNKIKEYEQIEIKDKDLDDEELRILCLSELNRLCTELTK